jgi:hypothetical protein
MEGKSNKSSNKSSNGRKYWKEVLEGSNGKK